MSQIKGKQIAVGSTPLDRLDNATAMAGNLDMGGFSVVNADSVQSQGTDSITVQTIDQTDPATSSASLLIKTGDAADGDSGSVNIEAGSATGGHGSVVVNAETLQVHHHTATNIITLTPYGSLLGPEIRCTDSMNINVENFSGALGLQAGGVDLVLVGGDDGGGQSYLQSQNGVRVEARGPLVVTDYDGSHTATLYAKDNAAAASPLNLSMAELQVNGAAGASGDVLTSQGSGSAPVWSVPTASGATARTYYVSKGGDDGTANGSISKPYLTVNGALAAITDASTSKRYVIFVQAGDYTESAISLKANVYIVGAGKNVVRVTATSWDMASDFTGGSDHRSGISNVILAGSGACGFNWTTVTSAAGKLYFDSVSFGGAVTLTGYNNATAQAQFSNCQFFGAYEVQGVNVGVFNDNILFSNITLTQSPFGGVPTILVVTGGYCGGTVTATTTVTDFNRRISIFARSFWMNAVTIDGASTYLDHTVDSLPSAGATVLNSANLVPIDAERGANKSLSNLNFPTAVNNPILPAATSATNLGDWGKQWLFNFNYVNVSTGTEIYIGTVDSSYNALGSAAGYSVYLQPDQYGVQNNVNGGVLDMRTANTTGTGISGKIEIATGTSVNGVSGDINITTGTTSGTGLRGVVNIESRILDLKIVDELKLNGAAGVTGDVLTSQGAGNAPIWDTPGRDAHIVLNSTFTGSGEVLVGSVYVEKNNLNLNSQSKAFMGVTVDAGGGVTAQAKVEIRQGATVYADFTTTSTTIISVDCNGILQLATGWYNIYLMCNEAGSSVALQGLYLKI